MINLILCGGTGTRLWPLSRTLMPKQFVKIFQGESLFQKTVRLNSSYAENQYIVSNADQFFLAKDQLLDLGIDSASFLIEPLGRNTAPAIALACLCMDPEELVLVSPSDHQIKDIENYSKVISRAEVLAKEGFLVTFGIKPEYPECGYGYIQAKGEEVLGFKEKPSLEKAQEFLAAGNYYWNAGIFCFKAGVFLEELKHYAPDIYGASKKALESCVEENETLRIRFEAMEAIPAQSIDYALMEHSKKVRVVPADIAWSDLGSFEALFKELPLDSEGNTAFDKHVSLGTRNCLVLGQDRLIATLDLENLMVIDSGDAVLVAPLSSSQKVKLLVDTLKSQGSPLTDLPQVVARPWGRYSYLEAGANYKIKSVFVRPGKSLKTQVHKQRSEHWVVLHGVASVIREGKKYFVYANESTWIPAGESHRLFNETSEPLELVEIQVGSYTEEDDISLIED